MHTPVPRGDRHEIDKAYAEAHERIRNAAPDLLAACERIVKMLSTLKDPTADERAAISIARAAIAKAQGR